MTTIQIAVRAIFALAVIVLLYNTITVDFNDEAFRGVRQKLRGSSVEQGDAKPTASENSTIQNNTQTVTHSVNATETVHVVDKAVDPKIMVSAVPDYLNEENNEGLRPVPPVQRPIDYQAKLNDDQRKMLSGLLANETDQRLQNIRSLYGMNGPRTWLEHFDSMPDELLFPMTKFAQKAIYEHQHPASCEGKSFVRIPIRISNGIGAAAHYAGEALGYALWDDRIAVLDLANPPLQKHIEVIDGNKNPFGRIFEEITSCQAYATEQNTKNLWDYEDPGAHRPTLPILGQAMLDQFPDITPNAMAVWARAQHVAYLLRLRPEALAYLAANRVNKDVQVGYTNLEQVPMPFPLPQKSWSMHVRHGDKGGEMRLVPVFREFSFSLTGLEKVTRLQNPDLSPRKWLFCV
ncbi:protein of unknown function [Taphrina deformans PYCC 5710]|uniref:Uncharacterized protein n=1 Tax=Taphrina deformans (strain PYCC 5710 / ATCC 11124 / CBS 356.35 / IMI 108563 / JCM 9778 / NBRC 8474) TaxID=1097556 RepID=R4XHF4_TAPDE|nr:protein of unknown function [Taphrina deformans PYCC 5710]|eukprot:CCG85114.1 protein of unknown function [Taphrina deformans PYCC 5710]